MEETGGHTTRTMIDLHISQPTRPVSRGRTQETARDPERPHCIKRTRAAQRWKDQPYQVGRLRSAGEPGDESLDRDEVVGEHGGVLVTLEQIGKVGR